MDDPRRLAGAPRPSDRFCVAPAILPAIPRARRVGRIAGATRGGLVTFIRVEKRDAVGIITIDRKERFNSLDVETARDLRKAGLSLARDEQVRAVILRGIPDVFCSGADLKYIRAGGDESDLSYLKPSQRGYGEV